MKKCLVCGKPATQKNLCSRHDKNHDPVPEHHVAADRTCLRCRKTFASTWAGDRRCPTCRERMHRSDIEAISRGHTPPHYESPYEPDGVPGIAT